MQQEKDILDLLKSFISDKQSRTRELTEEFCEYLEKWEKDKNSKQKLDIIFNSIRLAEQKDMEELCHHFFYWFTHNPDPKFERHEKLTMLENKPYNTNLFINFLKTLSYEELRRAFEEAIVDGFSEEIVISLFN